jgi:hypothetical protein
MALKSMIMQVAEMKMPDIVTKNLLNLLDLKNELEHIKQGIKIHDIKIHDIKIHDAFLGVVPLNVNFCVVKKTGLFGVKYNQINATKQHHKADRDLTIGDYIKMDKITAECELDLTDEQIQQYLNVVGKIRGKFYLYTRDLKFIRFLPKTKLIRQFLNEIPEAVNYELLFNGGSCIACNKYYYGEFVNVKQDPREVLQDTIGDHLLPTRVEGKMINCQIELTRAQLSLMQKTIAQIIEVFGEEIINDAKGKQKQFDPLRDRLV